MVLETLLSDASSQRKSYTVVGQCRGVCPLAFPVEYPRYGFEGMDGIPPGEKVSLKIDVGLWEVPLIKIE